MRANCVRCGIHCLVRRLAEIACLHADQLVVTYLTRSLHLFVIDHIVRKHIGAQHNMDLVVHHEVELRLIKCFFCFLTATVFWFGCLLGLERT